MNDRYGLLGSRPLPFPLWCRECGAVIADSNAHDRFHEAARASAPLPEAESQTESTKEP